MRRIFPPRLLLVAAIVMGASMHPDAARAQAVTANADGVVSVHAGGTSLGALLVDLGKYGRFEKLVVDPSVQGRPVTIALEGVTMRQAIVQVLDAANVNYALTADDDGRSMRLIAGEVAFIAQAQRALAQEDRVRDTPQAVVQAPPSVAESFDPGRDAPPGSHDTAPAADDPASAFQAQQLEQALAPPPVPLPVGSVMELPFPGPDGRPLTAIVQPKSGAVALPFPPQATTGNGQKASTPPAPPAPVDPETQRLIELLTAKPPAR